MLIDRILGLNLPVGSKHYHSQQALREAVPFEVSNVAQYIWTGTDQEIWGADDFPNVAPSNNDGLWPSGTFAYGAPEYGLATAIPFSLGTALVALSIPVVGFLLFFVRMREKKA